MKCVKPANPELQEGRAVRAIDNDAAMLVKTGHFVYCSKADWKESGRKYTKGSERLPKGKTHPEVAYQRGQPKG